MQAKILPLVLLLVLMAACQPTPEPKAVAAPPADLVAKGEYLVRVGQCNDCHTAGFAPRAGQVPVKDWLTGSNEGFLGPWGTTYPSNLRLSLSKLSEAEWLTYSSTFHTRPPMPDYMVRALSEEDRRAIYHFITSLGPAGEPAPGFLAPGIQPPPPYMRLVLPPPPPAGTSSPGTAAP